MLSDLERELTAAAGKMSMAGIRQLVAMGASKRFLARLFGQSLMGVAQVFVNGGAWEPEGPEGRLLIGVVHDDELVDVVAVASHRRDEWALRTGLGWALGARAIEDAQRALACDMGSQIKRLRIRLHATPFDWLAAGGEGVCILDWSAPSLMELRSLGERVTLEVPAGGADKIKGLLAYGGLPRVNETRDVIFGGVAA